MSCTKKKSPFQLSFFFFCFLKSSFFPVLYLSIFSVSLSVFYVLFLCHMLFLFHTITSCILWQSCISWKGFLQMYCCLYRYGLTVTQPNCAKLTKPDWVFWKNVYLCQLKHYFIKDFFLCSKLVSGL